MSIDLENFAASKDVILATAAEFIKTLKEGAVYKCLFIAVTDKGDVKSSREGGFYVTAHTRPEFLLMKIHSGVQDFGFNYKGVYFDSYSIGYKQWLLSKDIAGKIEGVEKVVDMLNRPSKGNILANLDDSEAPQLNVANYNRWLNIVGGIGEYKTLDSSKYSVNINEGKEFEFNLDVECHETAVLVSWVDKWIDKDKKL
ncbi:hypothetical protein OJ967_27885 (plasmid) [Peribacillus frigoritolerans]|uniref:hypothetical protein n=1 Tax=Peribacillus frigoritolerans TaxID=450367 RepID=UPI00222674A8|nr:hypothetical protein [Peribacillus frigoritolerans]UYZ01844.1 hypothetical protein OJ967_27885 [Peribacillus frigoritolerans]